MPKRKPARPSPLASPPVPLRSSPGVEVSPELPPRPPAPGSAAPPLPSMPPSAPDPPLSLPSSPEDEPHAAPSAAAAKRPRKPRRQRVMRAESTPMGAGKVAADSFRPSGHPHRNVAVNEGGEISHLFGLRTDM